MEACVLQLATREGHVQTRCLCVIQVIGIITRIVSRHDHTHANIHVEYIADLFVVQPLKNISSEVAENLENMSSFR